MRKPRVPVKILKQYTKPNGTIIFVVNSGTDARKHYNVAKRKKVWSCACKGWINRFPRKDCTHIRDTVKPAIAA